MAGAGVSDHAAPDLFGDVCAFLEKFGQDYDGPPRDLDYELQAFRLKHMHEELHEYEAWTFPDSLGFGDEMRHKIDAALVNARSNEDALNIRRAEQLDALVDLVYVTLQTARKHGFDFNEAWRRVHAANMRKEAHPNGKGGIRKPPGWVAPDHSDLV